MNSNPWEVSETEYQKNVQLFNQLSGGQPYMDANTARNALMRSNLPPQILAQIWALSDLDKDGRLDIREYSIAMRLAFNCIAGMPLPPQLPPSLLIVPSRSVPFQAQTLPRPPPPSQHQQWISNSRQGSIDQGTPERRMSQSYQQPFGASYPTAPPAQRSMSISSASGVAANNDRGIFEGRQLENWAIPHHNKLKYSQLFNALDKDRLGFLNTQISRSALGLSGLSTPALAHIWFLSDVNRDGKLSVDEYCISQFMIEMFKAGYALPQITPPELVRMCGISRSANNTPELEPGSEPPQKTPTLKTFEDKRQDNLARGQAELERRRQVLEEEENRRRAELEKKEREEQARRERERLEKERQLEMEREAEMERQRILAQQREEAERIRRAELDKRREEEEKQKQILAEKAKVKQMTSQKQQESERLAQRQQREKTLSFQLQALDEKATDIEIDIGKAKENVAEVTGGIEGMRSARDEKVGKIKELQQENQKLAIESQEMGHQLLQMQSTHKETTSRKNELENLRKKRDELKRFVEDSATKLVEAKEKNQVLREKLEENEEKYKNDGYAKLLAKREEYRKVFELFVHAQTQARSKLDLLKAREPEPVAQVASTNGFSENPFGASDPFASDPFPKSSAPTSANPKIPISESRNSVNSQIDSHETTKCRALFAFEARSEDELSFEPGDVIIVFQSHSGEPGWKAGQLHDRVGWFPEAFVEPIANVPQNVNAPPIQNMPPNMTPSCSLDQIPEEAQALRKAEIAKAMGTNGNNVAGGVVEPVLCQCIAQFQWRARNEDDLSFAKGDTIDVIEKQEMKWRGRKSTGESGWFPKSYVKVVGADSNSQSATPTDTPNKTVQSPSSNALPQYDVVPGAISNNAQYDTVPNSLGSSSDDWFIATYDFEAAEPTDLALKVGDRILVLEKNDDWWKGRCNGKEGIFPANYVEKATSPGTAATEVTSPTSSIPRVAGDPLVICHAKAVVEFVASAPNQLAIKVGDLIKVREKSAAGWWEGEIERGGKLLAGWFPGEYVKVVGENGAGTPKLSISGQGTATTTAIALFDYEANQADELSFSTGDLIVITDKVDSEWWTGHKHQNPAKSGLFPANYVQLQ
ncbi:unnamed protein product [Caenorhabditis angaria]|uniref:Uncharacterized protein n=1 Tax=Caenorhabditis angaria TaxID=860376 RepID=A0A9P1IML8_9PELO|nr:unnamed protein product [Caenorhabditis angaria]